MRVAARIQPRRQLTGPALAPELPLVAAALEAGTIGEDHLRVNSPAGVGTSLAAIIPCAA